MSPSWAERADFVFAATWLELSRHRWLRGPAAAPQRFEVVPAAGAAAGSPNWQPALQRLSALLAAERPAPAQVRISGRFCRFALAPWGRDLSAQEERALARAVFLETYGDASHGWEVRVDNLKRGAAFVACALDAELVAGLRGAFEAAGWRLDSIEPLFAAALAGADDRAGAAAASWHALLEPDWCSAALVEGEAFLAIYGAPPPGAPGAIARALDNETLRLAREVKTLRLLHGSLAAPAGEFSGWTVAQS